MTEYEDGRCSQRQIWERIKAIEDIFGDEFDLDLLCELIKMTSETDEKEKSKDD